MGIPVPGKPVGGCPIDCAMFPAGETPKILYCSVWGIERGWFWGPGDPEPWAGTKTLYQMEDRKCYWQSGGEDPKIMYWHSLDLQESLTVEGFPDYRFFTGCNTFRPIFALGNDGNEFFVGGYAVITYTPPVGTIASLGLAAALAGIAPMNKLFAESYATPDLEIVHRFSRLYDGTKVHIKLKT